MASEGLRFQLWSVVPIAGAPSSTKLVIIYSFTLFWHRGSPNWWGGDCICLSPLPLHVWFGWCCHGSINPLPALRVTGGREHANVSMPTQYKPSLRKKKHKASQPSVMTWNKEVIDYSVEVSTGRKPIDLWRMLKITVRVWGILKKTLTFQHAHSR